MTFLVLAGAGESGGGSSIDITQLLSYGQYGLLGIFVVLLLMKKFIVPAYTLTDLKDAHDRELAVKDDIIKNLRSDITELKKTVADLQALTSEKMIPALVQANVLSAAYVAELARAGRNVP